MKKMHTPMWLKRYGSPLTVLFFALATITPWYPPVLFCGSLLDTAWNYALGQAFVQGLPWGRDVVFTYGPWAFLAGPYQPATHALSLWVWSAVAAAAAATIWQLSASVSPRHHQRLLWCLLSLLLLSLGGPATVFMGMAGALVVLCAKPRSAPVALAIAALVAALASLTKSSWMMAVLPLVLLVSLAELTCRRWPLCATVYGAGLVTLWMLAGQPLAALVEHFSWAVHISAGYAEAMSQRMNATSPIVAYLTFSGLFVCTVVLVLGLSWRSIVPAAASAWLLLVNYKAGFVRYDPPHSQPAVALLLALAALVPLALCVPSRLRIAAAATGILLGMAVIVAQVEPATRRWLGERVLQVVSLSEPRQALWGRSLRAKHEGLMRAIVNDVPLPPIEGDVTICGTGQIVAFAHRLNFRAMPTIQSYQAYSGPLAAANARFLRSDHAPATVLFEIAPIDGRLPSIDDAPAWRAILERYIVVHRSQYFLHLRRRATPQSWTLSPISMVKTVFSHPIAVPDTRDGPVWASVSFKRKMAGEILGFADCPPIFVVELLLQDNSVRQYRLVSSLASAGFLLSPLITNVDSFALLSNGSELQTLTPLRVHAIRFLTNGSETTVENEITVTFERLKPPYKWQMQ
jgi:hypothetical protein